MERRLLDLGALPQEAEACCKLFRSAEEVGCLALLDRHTHQITFHLLCRLNGTLA